jgi:hypothetical protein
MLYNYWEFFTLDIEIFISRLTLSNLRSFNAFYNPFKHILLYRFDLTIQNSELNFQSHNQQSETQKTIVNECSFRFGSQDLDLIFGNLKITEFIIANVKFTRPICPFLFKNSQITNFIIIDPQNAFGFSKLTDNYASEFLNVRINQIYLNHTNNYQQPQWLDSEYILNPNMFQQLNRINIHSAPRLEYIQDNTFNRLPGLKILEINNVNLKDLLERSRRWIKNLNNQVPSYDIEQISMNSSISPSIFQLILWGDDEQKWSFNEDKDICLFRNFPHRKLVFPFILFTNEIKFKCSCTVYWLYKYLPKYQSIYNLNQHIVPFHCFKNSNWSNTCQYEELFDRYCPFYIPDPPESLTTLKPLYTTYMPSTVSFTLKPTIYPYYYNYSDKFLGSEFKLATFYIAVFLSIICVLIISVLIVLYYQVFNQNRQLECLIETQANNDVMHI